MHTHVIHYAGEQVPCNPENYSELCAELVKKHGHPSGEKELRVVEMNPAPLPPPSTPSSGDVSASGAARAKSDETLALVSGFVPKPPVYEIGTLVNSVGVENARRMQAEHDDKPFAREVARDLMSTIRAEERRDLKKEFLGTLRMSSQGRLVLPSPGPDGTPGEGAAYLLDKRAFSSLMGKMPCSSGTAYLQDCPTRLRAINFNHWAQEVHTAKDGDTSEIVLRTRLLEGRRTIFAAVSPSYTAFDADKITEALTLAFPEDARGSAAYDGQRMRVEGLWRTDVAPEEFVAGEIFKAGILVSADDTGAGSIRVKSIIWRNLCRNLIILDKAIGVDIRLRHMGSVEGLAREFQNAFGKALRSVQGFRKAWGYAKDVDREEALVAKVRAAMGDEVRGMTSQDLLPGLFNGIIEAELVPVRGRRKEVIPQLLEMHRQDEAAQEYGVSRASIINAFTRYAHQIETDPFFADEIREGAGGLLANANGGNPRPLPYTSLI